MSKPFEIFAVTVPGLEQALQEEAFAAGFKQAQAVPGGVSFMGHWTTVWRANLLLRGATRILARIGQFRAFHLAELERRAQEFPWENTFKPGTRIKVDVTAKASKIYHQRAAAERLERGLKSRIDCTISNNADVTLKVRIDNNICTLSVDTSGEALHKRGFKSFVGKAPMRETLAALLLRQCGFDGSAPLCDPMCGSGTFVLEAAELAKGHAPGRSRSFAFQHLTSFQPDRWQDMRNTIAPRNTDLVFQGSDRDAGAIKGAAGNAERAGLSACTQFHQCSISEARPPEGPPGLVFINPPYGDRIGSKKPLFALYSSFGETMQEHFRGWRVGLVTPDQALAKATKLPFEPTDAPIQHGGIRITLYQTDPLP